MVRVRSNLGSHSIPELLRSSAVSTLAVVSALLCPQTTSIRRGALSASGAGLLAPLDTRRSYNQCSRMLTSTALFVTIFIGLLAVGLLRHQYLPQWGKRSASASWPMAKANFLSGAVTSEVVGSEYEVFLTEILFNYSVLEVEFQGKYVEEFRTREEAEQMLRSLKQGPLLVRYHPGAPKDYFMDPYRDVRET